MRLGKYIFYSYPTKAIIPVFSQILILFRRGKGNLFNHLPATFTFLWKTRTAWGKLCCILFFILHYLFLLSAVPPPVKVGGPCNFTPQASRKCWSIPEESGGQNIKVKLNEGEDLFCHFHVRIGTELMHHLTVYDLFEIWVGRSTLWTRNECLRE